MTLQQFEYLLAICEHGNMLRASKKLGVTQPTLSIMLRKLETELDIDIFDRSTQPLRLTEAGKQVVKQAKEILKAAETLRQTVAEQRNLLTGRLKIGEIPTVAPYFVPRFLQYFLDNPRHTDLETSLSEMKTEDIIPALLENEIDMAVMATPSTKNDCWKYRFTTRNSTPTSPKRPHRCTKSHESHHKTSFPSDYGCFPRVIVCEIKS